MRIQSVCSAQSTPSMIESPSACSEKTNRSTVEECSTPKRKRTLHVTPIRKQLHSMIPGPSSPAVAILVKGTNRARAHLVPKSCGLKKLVRGVVRRSRKTIARQALTDRRTRNHVFSYLKKDIQKELTDLCSKKRMSVLRGTSPEHLSSFSWEVLENELKQRAPTFHAILQACVGVKRKQAKASKKHKYRTSSNETILGICASILLRHRNHHMNLLQRIISLILHSGHSSKQVYMRLQKVLLSLSRQRTLAYLDEVGKQHDYPVLQWRSSIKQQMESTQVVCQQDDNKASSKDNQLIGEQNSLPASVDVQSSHESMLTESSSCANTGVDSPSSHNSTTSSLSSPPYSDFTLHSSESSIDVDAFLGLPPKLHVSPLPSFKLVGDNIDKDVKPRDMRFDHQTRSLHYFHTYAVKDRIDLADVSDKSRPVDITKTDVCQLLPSISDDVAIKKNFAILICQVLRRHIPFFKKFGKAIERHIQHEFSHEMSEKSEVVPLGIELKSEQKYEDMVASLQEYVPKVEALEQVSVPGLQEPLTLKKHQFHKKIIGGDQMTASRIRGSKRVMSNSETAVDRLEGFSPLVEDWHAKVIFLEVLWKRLYSISSGLDGGTIFQLRNLVNRRNIRKHPHYDVNSSEDFFVTITESHILAAAMTLFDMNSLDDTPSEKYFSATSSELNPMERRQLLLLAANDVIRCFVNFSVSYQPTSTQKPNKKQDGVQEYASEVLSLGLLYFEFIDAIKEGDGERILRCWRYFMILFRVSKRKNYAIEAFTLLAEEKFILSPRQALQLKWSRTVNTHGRIGKNIPCDLHMEHLNKECKTVLSGLGSNITDKSVKRIGKCIGKTVEMLQTFDNICDVPKQSGYHTKRSSKGDIEKMVKQLKVSSSVFTYQSWRHHHNFPNFTCNMMHNTDLSEFKKWMTDQLLKIVQYS